MNDAIIAYMPWLLSVITIYMTLLAGNKHPSSWLVGLVGQALWLSWIVAAGAWGASANEHRPMDRVRAQPLAMDAGYLTIPQALT